MQSKFGKIVKWLLIILALGFALLQLKRPDHTNPAVVPEQTLEAQLQPPAEVRAILDRSCKDCHSNETRWPLYSHIAPLSWQIDGHVRDGRRQLNMSEWGTYQDRRKRNKLGEICEQVEDNEMPLNQYLWLHRDAGLSAVDKQTLCDWTRAEQNKLLQNPLPAATPAP